jgi:hypothetical protein
MWHLRDRLQEGFAEALGLAFPYSIDFSELRGAFRSL